MKSIDLGKKSGDACCAPMQSSPSGKDTMYYPSVYLGGDKDLGLPDSGTMTVKFRTRRESVSKVAGDDAHYSCEVELLEITDVKADKGESKSEPETTSDILDKYKKDAEEEDGE